MLLILIGLVAAAGAAPRFPFSDETSLENMFNDNMFSMKNFWQQFGREMATLEQRISQMSRNLPHVVTKEGVEGNEYKIEIPLTGFQESDISVKARPGLLKVVAQHNFGPGSTSNYIIARSLPEFVGASGDWTYENGILKIVFPLNNNASEGPDQQTVAPNHSREEIETDNTDTGANADIGLDKTGQESELMTNEIPSKRPVEGTTYAEGLKDDYEFVPLSRY
ncbi:uncharacterized protein LOC123714496 [Pieris brassicae]|uniref:SHSP domain-containing protein n=1 Tax=Pieris brassicae TaxID=7116 RepID=A0A9P0T2P2_PIEBR|nr:uncharacterized protein LOC123714496 [Pieris brassicae]CAH3954783.1 unnamed protein product [Pieris brassicae]